MFSGVGVLVTDHPDRLPVVPLRSNLLPLDLKSTVEILMSISQDVSEFHDGFHMLSSSLELTRASLYFSPPSSGVFTPDKRRRLGGRYLAALFGSSLPGVLATGVASPSYGVAVFAEGREVQIDDVR